MKILFATYSTAFENPGGGEQIIESIQSGLEKRGHTVIFYDPKKIRDRDLTQFDCIHYFSCVETENWKKFKTLAPGVPLLVTPTLYVNRKLSVRVRFFLRNLRCLVFRRQSDFSIPDLFLPCTEVEADSLRRYYWVKRFRIRVVPNGVDGIFSTVNEDLFKNWLAKNYGAEWTENPFVLHVGRIHPVKNHLKLIEAAGLARVRVIFIGSADSQNQSYFDQCKKLAQQFEKGDPSGETRFLFIPRLLHEDPLLASAYASCSLFVLMSKFETFGLVAFEAALSGAPLILSRTMVTQEFFKPWAKLFKPELVSELAQLLLQAKNQGWPQVSPDEKAERRKTILTTYDWDTVTTLLLRAYDEVQVRHGVLR